MVLCAHVVVRISQTKQVRIVVVVGGGEDGRRRMLMLLLLLLLLLWLLMLVVEWLKWLVLVRGCDYFDAGRVGALDAALGWWHL